MEIYIERERERDRWIEKGRAGYINGRRYTDVERYRKGREIEREK